MLIKLTNIKDETILIGVDSIIDAKEMSLQLNTGERVWCTKIQSRGAMVETNYVREGVEEIFELAKKDKKQARLIHENIRNILIKYGNVEYGDSIIDEISEAVGIPTTTIYYTEQ